MSDSVAGRETGETIPREVIEPHTEKAIQAGIEAYLRTAVHPLPGDPRDVVWSVLSAALPFLRRAWLEEIKRDWALIPKNAKEGGSVAYEPEGSGPFGF